MVKSPEQLYEQHREDAEKLEKAESAYNKSLKEAREAGDTTEHPKLWSEASADYQSKVKEEIAEAVRVRNYDAAEKLLRKLRAHCDGLKKGKAPGKPPQVKESVKRVEEAPVVNRIRERIFVAFSEADWQRVRDQTLNMLQTDDYGPRTLRQLAEMRKFDPERFDREIKITDRQWERLMVIAWNSEDYPKRFLFSMRNLKAINSKLFEKQFLSKMTKARWEGNWEKIMKEVHQSKVHWQDFLLVASAIKDLDPERFQQAINIDQEFIKIIWPQVVKEIEGMRDKISESSVPYTSLIENFTTFAGLAQNIKPEGEPDITINEGAWEKLKEKLNDTLSRGELRTFFSMVNGLSPLRIDKK